MALIHVIEGLIVRSVVRMLSYVSSSLMLMAIGLGYAKITLINLEVGNSYVLYGEVATSVRRHNSTAWQMAQGWLHYWQPNMAGWTGGEMKHIIAQIAYGTKDAIVDAICILGILYPVVLWGNM